MYGLNIGSYMCIAFIARGTRACEQTMIELDPSQFGPEITYFLMQQHAALPPLQWQLKPCQAAKESLDAIASDADLCARSSLVDEESGAAVRALLYLWNGWSAECAMYAQGAADKDRLYITALHERMTGSAADAKTVLSQLGRHDIHEALGQYAVTAIGESNEASIKRFKGIMEMESSWEAFLFIDLFEQARAGKLTAESDGLVRKLQCREFELLFSHCYDAAVGAEVRKRIASPRKAQPPRKRPPRQSPEQRTPDAPSTKAKNASPRKSLGPVSTANTVGVVCPKCQTLKLLPERLRGTKWRCEQCQTVFVIPHKRKPVATVGSNPPRD